MNVLRQLIGLAGQLQQVLADGFEKLRERLHVRARTFVQNVLQRQLCQLIDHQSQTHLPEIVPALLVVSPLRQFRPQIRSGDVRIEVGCVVGQSPELQLFDTNDFPNQCLLDLRQFVQRHDVQLIPEVLAGEIGGGELHQIGKIGCASPNGKRSFATRGAGSRDHGGHQRLAHGESGTNLDFAATGESLVDLGHVYALAGERRKALGTLEELKALSKEGYVSPVDFAIVYSGLSNADSTFEWLEIAYRARATRLNANGFLRTSLSEVTAEMTGD